MNFKLHLFLLASFILAAAPFAGADTPQQKDYLSAVAADKIRDAETVNERIKLFLTFAGDRLKKLQYELDHPSANRDGDMLNALLSADSGCVGDAADLTRATIERR